MTNIIKSKIKNVNNSKLKKSKLMSGGINDNIECKEELFTFQELFTKLNKKEELSVVLKGNKKIYNGLTIKKNKSLDEEQFITKCHEICNIPTGATGPTGPTGINESNEIIKLTELTELTEQNESNESNDQIVQNNQNDQIDPINIDNINKIATYFNLCFLIYINKIEKIIKINENASTKILLCEKEDTYKFMKYGNYDSLVCLNMEDFSEEFNSKIISGLNADITNDLFELMYYYNQDNEQKLKSISPTITDFFKCGIIPIILDYFDLEYSTELGKGEDYNNFKSIVLKKGDNNYKTYIQYKSDFLDEITDKVFEKSQNSLSNEQGIEQVIEEVTHNLINEVKEPITFNDIWFLIENNDIVPIQYINVSIDANKKNNYEILCLTKECIDIDIDYHNLSIQPRKITINPPNNNNSITQILQLLFKNKKFIKKIMKTVKIKKDLINKFGINELLYFIENVISHTLYDNDKEISIIGDVNTEKDKDTILKMFILKKDEISVLDNRYCILEPTSSKNSKNSTKYKKTLFLKDTDIDTDIDTDTETEIDYKFLGNYLLIYNTQNTNVNTNVNADSITICGIEFENPEKTEIKGIPFTEYQKKQEIIQQNNQQYNSRGGFMNYKNDFICLTNSKSRLYDTEYINHNNNHTINTKNNKRILLGGADEVENLFSSNPHVLPVPPPSTWYSTRNKVKDGMISIGKSPYTVPVKINTSVRNFNKETTKNKTIKFIEKKIEIKNKFVEESTKSYKETKKKLSSPKLPNRVFNSKEEKEIQKIINAQIIILKECKTNIKDIKKENLINQINKSKIISTFSKDIYKFINDNCKKLIKKTFQRKYNYFIDKNPDKFNLHLFNKILNGRLNKKTDNNLYSNFLGNYIPIIIPSSEEEEEYIPIMIPDDT